MLKKFVDLNCDMGESFGVYRLGDEAGVMPHISSANVACGFHAGDPTVMRHTILLAKQHGVGVGAHPGYPDLAGFGRRAMSLTPQEVYDSAVYQIGAFVAVARSLKADVTHVKVHGALYNTAAVDIKIATALAQAVRVVDNALVFVGLAGSKMIEAGITEGLTVAHEVFADRAYQQNGNLVPRSQPNSVYQTTEQAVEQVLSMLTAGTVTAITGETVAITADSVCLHGDGAHAVEFAQGIHAALLAAGIEIRGLKRR